MTGAVPRLPARPLPYALALGLLAQALFAWRVTIPHTLVFDEVHYVPAARTLWSLAGPRNIEHPLLGKTLIGIGMAVFGDGPLGWRAASTLAGTAVVLGVFAILWQMYREVRPALTGGLLAILSFTVFVQARIAMLDGFMAAFVVLAVAAMAAGARRHAAGWWLAGSVLLGLAVGVKWAAVPYVGYAGLGFLLLKRRDPALWPSLGAPAALAILAAASGATYLLTFAPAFRYADQPLTLSTLLPFQLDMYRQQTQVLPPHTYQSSWWTWPLLLRPIWYLYEPVDGAVRGILMLGNPAVMWSGPVAVAACAGGWLRTRDPRLGIGAALWIGGFGVWAIIPKSLGFYYYYYLPSIWLCVALPVAFRQFGRGRLRYWDEALLLSAALLFVYFYPILAATALPDPQAFRRWMWLPGWP